MKLSKTIQTITAITLSLTTAQANAQTIFHVSDRANAGGDGLSWETAFDTLGDALERTVPGDQVWVCEGIYVPRMAAFACDPRSATFGLPQGVALLGGFLGMEQHPSQRAEGVQTILSGNLGDLSSNADNAYHVVTLLGGGTVDMSGAGAWQAAVLDRLVIRDGRADGLMDKKGGGLEVQGGFIKIRDCEFVENHAETAGGGLSIEGAQARMVNTGIRCNTTVGNGGGINVKTSLFHGANVVLDSNRAKRGGGVYVHNIAQDSSLLGSHVAIMNGLITRNSALRGGGVYVNGSSVVLGGRAWLANCTIVENKAQEAGGGLWVKSDPQYPGELHLFNSIAWYNEAPAFADACDTIDARSSNLGTLSLGLGLNISSTPGFSSLSAHDYSLTGQSASIDQGDNSLVAPDLADVDGDGNRVEPLLTDLSGARRVSGGAIGQGPRVDQGAYEF